MQKYPEIRILSDDRFIASKLEFELSNGTNWKCSIRSGVEKELDNKNENLAVVIIVYDFVKLAPDVVLEKLKSNYPDAKYLAIVPEDVVAILKDFLSDVEVVDVVRDNDVILFAMIRNHVRAIVSEIKLQSRLNSLSQWENGIFLSNDPVMARPKEMLRKAADSEINVAIFGETGTGKEVVAQRIHALSARSNGPFVAVNVSAVPDDLIESAFFGHEKGAFTGAIQRNIGFFEAATGGTLFLDEIGEMDLKMQKKLLRALQEGVVTRVGGTREVKIDVRIITATHVDLHKSVKEGTFREDLFYRLMGLNIRLPRLCERKEDVLLLAEYFIKSYCSKNKKALCYLSKGAKDALRTYSFPGNIRELKAMMELAVVLCDSNVIKVADLSLRNEEVVKRDLLDVERTLAEYEAEIIRYFLDKYDGKVRLVSEVLDISRSKIYRLLQEEES